MSPTALNSTRQTHIKKQYDGYITFILNLKNVFDILWVLVPRPLHSKLPTWLLIKFMSKLGLVLKNLLNIGMDVPNVYKSFLKKLRKDLQEKSLYLFHWYRNLSHSHCKQFICQGINSLKSVIDLDRFAIENLLLILIDLP